MIGSTSRRHLHLSRSFVRWGILSALFLSLASCGDEGTEDTPSSSSESTNTNRAETPPPLTDEEKAQAHGMIRRAIASRSDRKAIGLLDEYLQRDPKSVDARLMLVLMLLQNSPDRDYDEAIQLASDLESEGVNRAMAYRARALLGKGDAQAARPALQTFLQRHAQSDALAALMAQLDLARVMNLEGELDNVPQLLTSVEQNATNLVQRIGPQVDPFTRRFLGDLRHLTTLTRADYLLLSGEGSNAEAILRSMIEKEPADAQAYALLAKRFEKAGDTEEGTRLRRVVSLLNDSREIRAKIYVNAEKLQGVYKELKTLVPDFPRAEIEMAKAYWRRNEHDPALDQCERILGATESYPVPVVAEAWMIRGRCMKAKGQEDEARNCFEKAGELWPPFRALFTGQ